ncbi:MAG: CYTH domain-containing protein [Magnetococcales bacterium]|nr:CYTH domain-containing protein [Magnetococcales bacterium]
MEQEVKLTATIPDTLDRVLEDTVVKQAALGKHPVEHPYVATYYDTPSRDLLNAKLAFRLCSSNNIWRVAVKGNRDLEPGGVGRWEEWEEIIPEPVESWHDLPDGPVREQITRILGKEGLAQKAMTPLLVTDIHRRALNLTISKACFPLLYLQGNADSDPYAETVAELALDRGMIRADGKSRALFEVELELKSGEFQPVKTLGEYLLNRFDLTPSRHSKFVLGLRLAGGSLSAF